MCETDDKDVFSFRISLSQGEAELSSSDSNSNDLSVPEDVRRAFQEDGFVVVPNVVNLHDVDALNDRLEKVLRGEYDRQQKPDKAPRLLKSGYQTGQFSVQSTGQAEASKTAKSTKPQKSEQKKQKSCAKGALGFSGNLTNVKVLQLINTHKCDHLFRRLATSRNLGKAVADLAGWKQGARLAQDQIWAKPPGAPPLVFHRDSPYFMFDDPAVVTVWLALDTMDEELGPLEYVKGSHLWGEGRVGTSKTFYQKTGIKKLMISAAEEEGLCEDDLEVVSMAGLRAGSISIHNGRTWHGSKRNSSESRPRRGMGLHFVPIGVKFSDDARHSKLWRNYWQPDQSEAAELCQEDFPITWQPS